ncbi:MAG: 1-phosphofructokinase family hexose kinase [Alphaproteobacteria bacterium]|nr:MAG: 1-phosphofructokinase family hexose kinase [Alphaproteobacteria bacterium]
MPDILTITLNPALDMSTTVDHVRPEAKLRCERPVLEPGGGGVNVARAVGILGGRALALIALAGFNGQQYLSLLANEPIVPIAFAIPGETRQSLAVIDRDTGEQYRFVMPGPRWDSEHAHEALTAIDRAMGDGSFVVLSGSQPPGVPLHFPADLAAIVEERGGKLILDTSGKAMKALLGIGSARQHVLRLDGEESAELAGRPLRTTTEVADFAEELVTRGVAEVVVLAMGENGSVLVENGKRWHAVTEKVKVRSKVGAGDSFVGAFTLARSRGAAWEEALVQGVAAASAAVMTDGTELCRRADVEALARTAKLTRI